MLQKMNILMKKKFKKTLVLSKKDNDNSLEVKTLFPVSSSITPFLNLTIL